MKELKLELDDGEALECRLAALGAHAGPQHWIGNWYLETTPSRVRKIVQQDGNYRALELEKREQGFAFTKDEAIGDIAPFNLDETAAHNILHKTVRPWTWHDFGIDILLFEDIAPYFCVNYEDPHLPQALDFVKNALGFANPVFLEVPFNVVKRRALGMPDFDEVSYDALAIKDL